MDTTRLGRTGLQISRLCLGCMSYGVPERGAHPWSLQQGWTPFVSMQNYVNLLYREEEREMLPLCRDQGVAVIPWSPLARGRLTRPFDTTTARTETDTFGRTLYAHTADADRRVVEAVQRVATRLGVPMARVALAWVLRKPGVNAPIIGATRLDQLDEAVAALSLQLSDADVTALEAPYVPHAVVGFV